MNVKSVVNMNKRNIVLRVLFFVTMLCMVWTLLAPVGVYADVFYDTGLEEYLFFDSFENCEVGERKLPSGWTEYEDTYAVVDNESSDGKKSVFINDPSSSASGGLRTKHIPIEAGHGYKVEFDCKTVSGGAQIYMEFWDESGTRHKSVTIINCTSRKWKSFKGEAVAPEGTVTMTILLYLHSSNVGDSYYDNIRVTKNEHKFGNYEDKEFTSLVKGYPRLYYTAETEADFVKKALNDKPNYTGTAAKTISDSLIANADKYVTEKKFSCSYYNSYKVEYTLPLEMPGYMDNPPEYLAGGQYPYWTALGSAIRGRMQTLALAYVLTGNEKYSRRAIDWCLWLSEWKSWSDPTYGNGTGCLDSGYITYGVCTVYDMLYDVMTEKERETVKKAIYERSLKAHLTTWNTTTDHNVQMVQTAALGTAGALLLGEYPEAEEAINRALEYFKVYLDKRLYSGNHEGNMYTSLSMEYMMVAVDHIARVTGDRSTMEHAYLSDFLFKWMIAGGDNITGSFADIGDASVTPGFFITASVLSSQMKNGYAGFFLKRTGNTGASFEGLVYRVDEPYTVFPGELQSVYLKEIGWGAMRTGWTEQDSMLVFTASGSSLGHNHYDNNSFVMNVSGIWVASDPGYQDYSPGNKRNYTLKDGHSTIYIDGSAQDSLGYGTIDERMTSSFFSHFVGDASYNYYSGINEFLREFILVNHKETPYYIIRDNIESDGEEHEYTWRLNVSNATDFFANGKKAELGKNVKAEGFKTYYGNDAVLNGSFAFADKLDMTYYKYAGEHGYLLDVKGEKGKTAAYTVVMTAIPKEGDKGNISTYFENVSLGEGEKAYTSIDSESVLLYTPGKEKDELAIDLFVGISGEYDLTVDLMKLEYGGLYDVYVDDAFVTQVDLLSEGKNVKERLTASLKLSRGDHKVRFINAGSSKMYVKQYLGLTAVKLETKGENDNYITITDEIDNELLSAMKVSHDVDSDTIIFSKNSADKTKQLATISAYDVSANGVFAAVFGENGKNGYALEKGTELSYKGEKLISSDVPVNVSMDGEGKLTAICDKASKLTVKLLSDGVSQAVYNGSTVEIKPENGYAEIHLAAGRNEVTFVSEKEPDEAPEVIVDDVTVKPVSDTVAVVLTELAALALIIIIAAVIIRKNKVK